MAKLQELVARIQVITGVTKKQNRALREIGELLAELCKFLTEYDVPEKVFADDNVVRARVDVSSLMHKIRTSERIFKEVGNKQLTPLIMDVYDKLESIRVDVYNPHKGRFSLNENLAGLRVSVEAISEAISDTEFK